MLKEVQSRKPKQGGGHPGQRSGARTAPKAKPSSINKIGIWIEGFDRLGAAYEGIWRVIKRFLLSSDGAGKNFCFVAPARFREEIEEFLSDLPDAIRSTVDFHGIGKDSDTYLDGEPARQAGQANDLNVDAWLVPNPMWSSAKHLVKPKVVWFHDFLLAEFPQSYPHNLYVDFQRNIRDLSNAGAVFIFLSPHVKQKHGHEACGISPDRSMLVVTPSLDVSTALSDLPSDPRYGGDWIRSELSENLRSWCTPAHAQLFYHHISTYPFESVPYFFVSSQNREHKAFLRLAQIHAAMLREHYIPYSIFTTALVDVLGHSPLEKFLKTELLMGDFMSVGKVSDLTHALLIKFARMTLHPSTFEGNFPLPFAESVSLGTPCIIPYSKAYSDLVDKEFHPWIFYSPTEPGLIAKVREVEIRRPEFLLAQRQVLKKMRSYSLKDYFRLQMQAFDKAATIEPDAAQFLFDRRESSAPADRPSLKNLFKASFARANAPQAPAKFTLSCTQARIWPRFTLAGDAPTEADSVLYLAEYLGATHPRGDTYFLVSVSSHPGEVDLNKLGLFAELGSWINNAYVVADSKAFRFDPTDPVPSEVADAAKQSGLVIGERDKIGWTKLNWGQGIVPEIRLGGRPVDGSEAINVRLVCVTGVGEGQGVSGSRLSR